MFIGIDSSAMRGLWQERVWTTWGGGLPPPDFLAQSPERIGFQGGLVEVCLHFHAVFLGLRPRLGFVAVGAWLFGVGVDGGP